MLHLHRVRAGRRAGRRPGRRARRRAPATRSRREVVAVPARGVERWLTQRLSHHLGAGAGGDGVCANVVFPWPSRLVADAVAAGSGIDPGDDPWRAGRLLWSVLDVIDACVGEPWCARWLGTWPATTGAGSTQRRGRRWSSPPGTWPACSTRTPPTGRRCCATGWPGATPTGSASRCPTTWPGRPSCGGGCVRAVGTPSPAERLDAACAALRADPALSRPAAAALGLRADPAHRRPGRRAGRARPSTATCTCGCRTRRPCCGTASRPTIRPDDGRRHPVGSSGGARHDGCRPDGARSPHPLLSSLGRDARELQLVLRSRGRRVSDTAPPAAPTRRPPCSAGSSTTCAATPHRRARRSGAQPARRRSTPPGARRRRPQPAGARLPRPGPAGRGAARGAARTARRRPHPRAARRAGDVPRHRGVRAADLGDVRARRRRRPEPAMHPGHRLRVRLADRSLRQTNPLLATMAGCSSSPTRGSPPRRCSTWPRCRRCAAASGSTTTTSSGCATGWRPRACGGGSTPPHRAPFRLDGVAQNTWQAGLDRMLLGVAMAEDEPALARPRAAARRRRQQRHRPGRPARRAGRPAGGGARRAARRPAARRLAGRAVDRRSTASPMSRPTDAWQLSQARRQLADVAEAAGDRAEVTLSARRRAGAARRPAAGPPDPGQLPHRQPDHVLDGADALGAAPRDLPARARRRRLPARDRRRRRRRAGPRPVRRRARPPQRGPAAAARRDPRRDEHLVVLLHRRRRAHQRRAGRRPCRSASSSTSSTRPCARPTAGPAATQVVVRHPLQPFDARNFTPGALGTGGRSASTRAALAGARARAGHPASARAFLSRPAAPRRHDGDGRARRPGPLPRAPGARRSCASGSASLVAERGRRARRRAAGRARRACRSGRSATAGCRARLAGADGDALRAGRVARAAACRRARSGRACPASDRSGRAEPLVAVAAAARPGAAGESRRRRAAARRAQAHRHRRRRARAPAGARGLLPARRQAPAACLGRSCSPWRPVEPDQQWQAVTLGRGRWPALPARPSAACRPTRRREVLGELVDLYRRGLAEPLPLPPATSLRLRRACGCVGDGEPRCPRGRVPGSWAAATSGGRRPLPRLGCGATRPARRAAGRPAAPRVSSPVGRSRETHRFGALALPAVGPAAAVRDRWTSP